MLNSEIKRKIDNARNILVGKIPVPSQQIEQITVGLIYKFMSDIDLQDKELGGEGFFQGEFEKYSWNNIMDRKIGGQERLNLYSEGLDRMGTNPHLPQMFRDIFRNAYLPFKDPSTLDMFLKQIDEFSYDHSEDLGDAFEYLLSTAGSQGDAGQFRTPRHIIDFIVSIVQPQLTDTVLDPACGTAGFLISAYKYIMNQNKDKVAGDKLSITQKKELTQHFVGYDISYEMVRLSLVNMYLHNFGDPKIFEYDTLSNDDRWDDRFDCILANPPFMTPKGGIQPHNRFSIKASKSEVLFVDYMIEHLNPHGKAGIVVPEGIIFQGANAYKDLRKKMIKENYLWAVVSLPAGVFQPYSGVKTSILLFDKELAKKTDKILFVKVQNDGFDLGAQRRPSNKNDLPKATEILLQYKKDLLAGNEINLPDSEMTLLVNKEKIEENSEFNLSMDRYREGKSGDTHYEIFKLKDVAKIDWGNTNLTKSSYIENGSFLGVSAAGCDGRMDNFEHEVGVSVLSAIGANCGKMFYPNEKFTAIKNTITFTPIKDKICPKYLYYVMTENQLPKRGGGQPFMSKGDVEDYEIPLPPLEVQEKIVAELDGYQKVIDGAKMIVDNYKPTIKINPDWEMVKLGDYIKLSSGDFLPSSSQIEGEFLVYGGNGVTGTHNSYNTEKSKIIIGRVGAYCGCVHITKEKSWITDNALIVELLNSDINFSFLALILNQINLHRLAKVGGQPSISQSNILSEEIPLPSLEEQNQIVAEIEKEESMVESAKQLIEVFEKKIKDRIDEIWGK